MQSTNDRTPLWLLEIGNVILTFHRNLPEDAEIKSVTGKCELTGERYALSGAEILDDPLEQPVDQKKCASVSTLKHGHDTGGQAVELLD